jgi:hypothetical protein
VTSIALQGRGGVWENPRPSPKFTCVYSVVHGAGGPVAHRMRSFVVVVGLRFAHRGLGGHVGATVWCGLLLWFVYVLLIVVWVAEVVILCGVGLLCLVICRLWGFVFGCRCVDGWFWYFSGV